MSADIEPRVSRETRSKLELLQSEVVRWQRVKNLVSAEDLGHLWKRHILDSLPLVELGKGETWVDLGSGAGFPGLVVAAAAPTRVVHLIESNGRKCAFLRHASRLMAPNAVIHHNRLENILPTLPGIGTVSARALAPLTTLLGWAEGTLDKGAIGIFPKGRDVLNEVDQAAQVWRFEFELLPSPTSPDSRIVRITSFHGRR